MLVCVCGRYAAAKDQAGLVEAFEVDRVLAAELPANYNVAPSTSVYVIRDDADDSRTHRELLTARWGLVPTWAKDPAIGARMINARLETAAEKPAYRQAFAKRRCLVPADGYYEWYTPTGDDAPVGRSGKPVKQPFFIHRADGAPLAMAGLLSWWRASDADDWQLTMAILTTEAADGLRRIHDRMPVMVERDQWDRWLDPRRDGTDAVGPVLTSGAEDDLVAYPVSTAVNSVRNNGPELLLPISAS